MPSLAKLNDMKDDLCRTALTRCCGSSRWLDEMIARRPYASTDALFDAADNVWKGLGKDDYLEAFSHHPQIGNVASLKERFASTSAWASGEQAAAQTATDTVLNGLAEKNKAYLEAFGYIFIVCASGKSAEEMLEALQSRLGHTAERELAIAAGEQQKITRLRLEKLLQEKD